MKELDQIERFPKPNLEWANLGDVRFLSDKNIEATCGVKIAFTSRHGGVSLSPYASLNLGSHVNDDPACVGANRNLVARLFGIESGDLIFLNQVHGQNVLVVKDDEAATLTHAREIAKAGADAIVVCAKDVAGVLCFADCVPLIVVSPTGNFAVIHAGWRGVMSRIAVASINELVKQDVEFLNASSTDFDLASLERDLKRSYNVYIGPYIHAECFEVSVDLANKFEDEFGGDITVDARHVDLGKALTVSLIEAGISRDRICDSDICTVCSVGDFFSYRAEGGVCGRHGACACRIV